MTARNTTVVTHAAPSTAQRMAAAARIVASVVDAGRSLDDALQEEAERVADAGRAALQALSFGTLRLWPRLDRLVALLLDQPTDRTAAVIRALLAVGLHQLARSTHPPHAIVNETVEATRHLRAARASGLVNAILRRYLRDASALEARLDADAVTRFAHPPWLIEAIRSDWPDHWREVLEANNRAAPLWLRVNSRRVSAEDYLAHLVAQGISATRSAVAEQAIALEAPRSIHELPGFADGDVSAQDAAAQLAAPLLACEPGMRVLDACAAPGGKACHALELTPAIAELVALDVSPRRLQRVRENLDRLRLAATLLAGDAREPHSWWDGRAFDRILVDAPCSGSGVIRRHPDIKVLRRPSDIARMAATQRELLHATWGLLAPGGRLVYATCSVLAAENESVIEQFLQAEPAAVEVRPTIRGLAWSARPGARIMPGEAGMDGFYYACLEKSPTKVSPAAANTLAGPGQRGT